MSDSGTPPPPSTDPPAAPAVAPTPGLPPNPPPPPQRRGCLGRVIALLVLVGLLALGSGLLHATYEELHRPRALAEPIEVVIPRGTGLRRTSGLLEEAGLVRWARTFEAYARLKEAGGRLKSGRYRFEGSVSPADVLERITAGVAGEDRRVTLVEGLTRWEVARELERAGICSADAFLSVVTDAQEGRLFPDTYRFFPDTPASKVVATLTGRFDEVWGQLLRKHPGALARARSRGLGVRELTTLASIVEKEAQVASERPKVARVIYNRLKRGMKLQCDPTCVYGAAHVGKAPTPALCRDPASRYSTYVIPGLPPGPIANPGRASLEAALEPYSGPGAASLLYFVARRDGTGRHDFSATAKEHGRKVRRYLGPKKPGRKP